MDNSYSYIIKQEDPFSKDFPCNYFIKDGFIYNIKKLYRENHIDFVLLLSKFDINNKIFTQFIELKFVPFEQMKKVSFFFDNIYANCLVDIENNQYTLSKNYEYYIYIMDGNFISNCIFNNKCYTFHSVTQDYETGVFVYDQNQNIFNTECFTKLNQSSEIEELEVPKDPDEFEELENNFNQIPIIYTNNFNSLHKKNIISCCSTKDCIIILYKSEKGIFLAKYNPEKDDLVNLTSIQKHYKIFYDEKDSIILYDINNSPMIYNLKTKIMKNLILPDFEYNKEKCEINFTLHTGIYNNNIVSLNHYFTISNENEKKYFKSNSLEIIKFPIQIKD